MDIERQFPVEEDPQPFQRVSYFDDDLCPIVGLEVEFRGLAVIMSP
jgi:hypothetical protein